MARRSKIEGKTRSDIIREYLEDHPSAGPKTVVKALKDQGIDVSEGLVGQVKYLNRPEPAPLSADDLITLKKLAHRLGGVDRLREAVDKLKEVMSLG